MYRYTRVLKGALFALLFSLSALLPSYAAITADGPGSGVAGPRAVSYTHLDVYKRQVQHRDKMATAG